MTITTPPQPPYAAGPPAGSWAPVPPPPAVFQQSFAHPPRRRPDPAQVWTVVVAGVIGLVAIITTIAVGTSGDSPRADLGDQVFGGDSSYSGYYGDYDDGCDFYSSGC